MSQFEMPFAGKGDRDAFRALDPMARGYIEAAFFTNSGDRGDPLNNCTFADMALSTVAQIAADCTRFVETLPRDGHGRTWLDLADDYRPSDGYSLEMAGRDFWFTRNRHGAGFCDRGLGAIGDRLTEHCRAFPAVDLYRGDDGSIYQTAG